MLKNTDLLAGAIPPLTRWYEQNRKPLPWRVEPTPYHVWISEIMLQQTRIEAVIPYYQRFLAELPDVQSLAAVEDDRLMKLWQGLGYYSRARNLKKAAILLCEEYGGRIPFDAEKLRRLPGVGDYTAGAIASIAYGRPEPAVDGNVLRVVSRICACPDDIALPETKRAVTGALRAVYPEGEAASLLTQGLMELGETICVPNGSARCALCPIRDLCRACAEGDPERYPTRAPKNARRVEEKTVLLLLDGRGRAVVRRRPDTGLLAGLYEFPMKEKLLSEDEVREALEAEGFAVGSVENIGKSKHLFTHIEWNMVGYAIKCEKIPPEYERDLRDISEILTDCATPTALKKYTAKLRALI